jgi:hypothetical protein
MTVTPANPITIRFQILMYGLKWCGCFRQMPHHSNPAALKFCPTPSCERTLKKGAFAHQASDFARIRQNIAHQCGIIARVRQNFARNIANFAPNEDCSLSLKEEERSFRKKP